MKFHILTLFPEMIESALNTSIIGRAAKSGLIVIDAVNIRDYTDEPHGKVDDYPYGGGAGMIMQAQPIYDCFKDVAEKIMADPQNKKENAPGAEPEREISADGDLQAEEGREPGLEGFGGEAGSFSENSIYKHGKGISGLGPFRVLYTSPSGRVFDQGFAKELSEEEDLIILCGHYEGVDERALELIGAEDVSIGDYVLTGGELAAMVIVDAVSRMVPGVLTNEESPEYESFTKTQITRKYIDRSGRWPKKRKRTEEYTLLEYPQYTRPREYMGLEVPEILLSGNHENVDEWRKEQALERTRKRRPDMLEGENKEQKKE